MASQAKRDRSPEPVEDISDSEEIKYLNEQLEKAKKKKKVEKVFSIAFFLYILIRRDNNFKKAILNTIRYSRRRPRNLFRDYKMMSPASRLRLFRRDFTRRLTKLLKQPRRPESREHLPRRYSLRLDSQRNNRFWWTHYVMCYDDCGKLEHRRSGHCVDIRYWGVKGVGMKPRLNKLCETIYGPCYSWTKYEKTTL